MSDLKINCPICNQEFPAYDQRGFRNAGFTSHYKKCLERQQQPSDSQQRDQHASRASRFALAVRRRLLPARPSSSTSQLGEGQNRISPLSSFSGSSSTSPSSSSTPSNRADIAPAMTLVVPSQTPHPKDRFHPQHRHTWNHWTHRRKSRRFTLSVDTTSIAASSGTVPAGTTTTLSDARLSRSRRSLHTMDTEPDSPTFPLLTAITTMDSTTALIIPQVASPQLSNQTPVSSPMISGDGSPFSFTSMLTTLPLESAPLLPSATISTCSSNNNNNDRNSLGAGYQRPTQHTSMDSIPTDWTLGQYIYPPTDDEFNYHHHYQQDQHQASYGTVNINATSQQPRADNTYYHHNNDNVIFPVASTSSSSPDTLPKSLRSPETLDCSGDSPIYCCGYCQPRNGQHHPSCSLMQFLMMDIIGHHDDPSSSSF